MADKSETIRIQGLTEFRKELAQLTETTFTRELKDAHYDVANLVVGKAKSLASMPVQRKASGSLFASKSASKAQIRYGGDGYPYAMGAEFGSNRYTQFAPHLGRKGYFVYPAVRASNAEIMDIYGKAIDKITKRAFPD